MARLPRGVTLPDMATWALEDGNLSPAAANRKVRGGIMALTMALFAAVLMARFQLSWPWMTLLFMPFFVAGYGFLQGLYRT